jgi:hypothetical protein
MSLTIGALVICMVPVIYDGAPVDAALFGRVLGQVGAEVLVDFRGLNKLSHFNPPSIPTPVMESECEPVN